MSGLKFTNLHTEHNEILNGTVSGDKPLENFLWSMNIKVVVISAKF